MGFEIWTDDGYGIKTTDLKIRNIKDVWRLLDMDKELADRTREYLIGSIGSVEDATLEDITCFTREDHGFDRPGIAGILSYAIRARENISLMAIGDGYGDEYLLLPPHYSWDRISEEELNITKDDFDAILNKYVSVVSDTPIDPDYQSVENWG